MIKTKSNPTHRTSTNVDSVIKELGEFCEFGTMSRREDLLVGGFNVPVFTNEFWTSKQRAADPLHEVSYRACFKPQLPRFFIDRFTQPGDVVYDPFMGRGTTLLEASLRGRRVVGCDINPVSRVLIEPRLSPPSYDSVCERLLGIDLSQSSLSVEEDLFVFYHPDTLMQISALKAYLQDRVDSGFIDVVDKWIQMVATNRLTGHSPGFFSVYTMPPNQAVTAGRQRKINEKRSQVPPIRDVKALILKKSRSLLRGSVGCVRNYNNMCNILLTGDCSGRLEIEAGSVNLVVTSPPFLDVVDYQSDNWLRCWFNGVDAESIPIWQMKSPQAWVEKMSKVFLEIERVLVSGGIVAFEVGEVRGGRVLMEHLVLEAAKLSGLKPEFILINDQTFTKTANCWGVSNSKKGTNTNRIVVLRKLVC